MRINREQGLLAIVLLVGLWLVVRREATTVPKGLKIKEKDYQALRAPLDPLAPAGKPGVAARDGFLEPSESAPLPPCALPFPDLGPLPVVAPPLDPGPQAAALWRLRIPGGVIQRQALGAAAAVTENGDQEGAAPGEAATNGGATPPVPKAPPARGGDNIAQEGGGDPSLLYDRIMLDSGPIWGFIRKPDKYDLAGKRLFTEPIVYDRVALDGRIMLKGAVVKPEEVRGVELAKSLRNRLELRRRGLDRGQASLPKRAEFIEDLLREASKSPWVYELAAQQAEEYLQIAQDRFEGYRLKLRVLRHRGDLAQELQLCQNLPEDLRASALARCSMGELAARLGLERDAEQHLAEAVATEPTNARCRAAYARFLLDRGQAAAALEHAEVARRNAAPLAEEEIFEVGRTLLAVQLGLGNTAAAAEVFSMLPSGEAFTARREWLRGCVDWTAGDRAAASTRFSATAAGGHHGGAALGLALGHLLNGRWVEAEASLQAVAAAEPLLRHRALAALALLYERTGNQDQAVSAAEAAVRAHPQDVYALYMLGRSHRLASHLDAAVGALQQALVVGEGFAEGHAEMAAAQLAIADAGGQEVASALYAARRHIDRAVALDAAHGHDPALLTLQGQIRFRLTDFKVARESFELAQDKSLPCRIGVALVEYAQNRVEEARGRLAELKNELKVDNPLRAYVEATLARIDDNSEKEQVRDAFERDDLGRSWDQTQANGNVKPQLVQGQLRIAGKLTQAGRAVYARRNQPSAGAFLQAEITMRAGGSDQAKFAGLQISTRARRDQATADFRARLGVSGRKPVLLIEDGDPTRARDDEERKKWDTVDLNLQLNLLEPQRLVLQVVQSEGNRFVLRALWNDQVVHERGIEKISRTTKAELPVDLIVEGNQDASVEVSFDEFRLVRRQEK